MNTNRPGFAQREDCPGARRASPDAAGAGGAQVVIERPILYQGAMVRALLAGTKEQTRRVMKPQPRLLNAAEFEWRGELCAMNWLVKQSPYGIPGYRLWVRESLYLHKHAGARGGWLYTADNAQVTVKASDDAAVLAMVAWAHHKSGEHCPSIHMPRWASRILLEVTDVRVQRLQDISEADALAEGVEAMRCPDCHLAAYGLPGWGHDELNPSAVGAYRFLWESINGAGSWDANPWVWAVSFKRIAS